MKQDNFSSYHPIINFVYFVFVIGCSMFLRHPVFLGISCVSGFIYYIYLKGKKAFKTALWLMIPVFLISALVNPLFNHEGVSNGQSPDVRIHCIWTGVRCDACVGIKLVFLLSGHYDLG
mgnify:CR=1 FL=1